ncbi:MAG: hypothetical protein IB618_03425 [Candidatus Pacearchaeota archaeon]|nr:MAG: hypothetical protein IB618_03425 [Candidatus Pacearchaeota archaeon]
MIHATYQQLIERIARLSGLGIEEIQRRVDAKKAKLSGLISSLGAAQVVAAELGISFEKQKFKVIDMLIGMKKIQTIGKVIEIYPTRKFRRAEHEGEIGSFLLADDSSSIRVVLWDTHHIDKIKNGTIKKDSVVDIKNADVRGTTIREIHLSSNSSIELSDKEIKTVKIRKETLPIKKLSELQPGEGVSVRGNIVQVFQPNFFMTCPECGMKVSYEGDKAVCMKHNAVIPKKRALISLIIDDGSESMRAVAFNETITNIFKIKEEEIEKLQDSSFMLDKKQEILGAEMLFSGRARKNVMFNRNEFIINSLKEVNPDDIIMELSK